MNAKPKEPRQERRQARWVLAALDKRGWVNPALLAILADYPIRAVSSCLRRLHRWGFVQRRHNAGLALYAISERGRLMGRLRRSGPGQPANSRQSPQERPPAALRGTISAGRG